MPAEPDLNRFIRERAELEAQRARFAALQNKGCGPTVAVCLLIWGALNLLGTLFVGSGRDSLALSLLMLLLGMGLFSRARSRNRQRLIDRLERRIADLDRLIDGERVLPERTEDG